MLESHGYGAACVATPLACPQCGGPIEYVVLFVGVGPGEEFVDAIVEMPVDDLGDEVGEVGLWIDAGELTGLDR